MSDENYQEDFTPIDLTSLESFDQEVSTQKPETQPDFDRFKLLFDPSELEAEEVSFDALYAFTKEVKQELFEPLIEGTGANGNAASGPEPEAAEEAVDETETAPSPEEQGFEKGFQKGLAKGEALGRTEGEAKGFEQGYAKGEAEGLKKGEAQGLAKGEAAGMEQGTRKGLETARAEVLEEAGGILEPLKLSLETADQLLEQVLTRYEHQIIELVYKIAEKAVLARLDSDDEIVKHTILDAVQSLVAPEEINLSVSTDDYEYVEMIKESFFESVRSLKHVAVTSDPMIPKGGCRIESAAATISTDPESKLRAVYDAVAGASRS